MNYNQQIEESVSHSYFPPYLLSWRLLKINSAAPAPAETKAPAPVATQAAAPASTAVA